MTEDGWTRVEPLFQAALGENTPNEAGSPRVHTLREVVECIRLALGTAYSGSKCPGNKSFVQSPSCCRGHSTRGAAFDLGSISGGPLFNERSNLSRLNEPHVSGVD